MSSKTYWEKREAEALKHYLQEEQEYQAQLRAIYQNMSSSADVKRRYFMPEEIITAPNENAGAAAGKPAGTPEVENEPKEKPVDAQGKKYSDEDLDRILAGKIARERRKLTESISSQLAAELDERERNILKRELRADAQDKLIADRLPPALAECLNYEDKEAFDKSYSSIVKAFQDALAEGVRDALRGNTPRAIRGSGCSGGDRVRDAFARKD